MNIVINDYKGLKQQNIDFSLNKHIVLIGENGCGKSRILESIFQNYLDSDNLKIICFSSGQNEKFSNIFKQYTNKAKKYDINEASLNSSLKSFYFTKNWIKLLIFFAIATKTNSRTLDFLKTKQINIENIQLVFYFRVLSRLVIKIKQEIETEEKGIMLENALIRTIYYDKLVKMIDYLDGKDFSSELYNIKQKKIKLSKNNFYDIFGRNSEEIFTFFAVATNNSLNINLKDIDLQFDEELNFKDLSDGEYQLLALYSILDLFDSQNTIFLFDEIDSHLHYKNNQKLWNNLNSIEGYSISTSHIVETIVGNNIETIKIVKNGNIQSKYILNEIIDRLEDLTINTTCQYYIALKCENIVLIDDTNDWEIFKFLCQVKIDDDLTILDKIYPIKCNSGFKSEYEIFGFAKLQWLESYCKFINTNDKCLQNIFMLCDKDCYNTNDIKDDLTLKWNKNIYKQKYNVISHFLAWKRREIENYLISYTMLKKYNKLHEINNDSLAVLQHIKENDNCDSLTDIKELRCKDIIQSIYSNDKGDDLNKIQEVISCIPKEEISDDIVKMFNFLKKQINKKR
ncbi:AAA family ATPase [Campylobacter sp. RM12637]|uniref:AAA family ATPase n=1 Tax=Campylobacter sp. RM12637 TaxID=2735734 RepID=UPI003014AA20|nr:AAA family ATPase [Campylobacter sp. RM12637]